MSWPSTPVPKAADSHWEHWETPRRKNDLSDVCFSVLPQEGAVAPLMYVSLQELQYALRQQPLPPSTNRGPSTEGAADPRAQGHTPSETPEVTTEGTLGLINMQYSPQIEWISFGEKCIQGHSKIFIVYTVYAIQH